MKIQPIILSGGAGTRLWPSSRELYPKQLLSFKGDFTLLQNTLLRLNQVAENEFPVLEPIIVCNEEHRFLVAEQCRQVENKPGAIILEPVGRNTAPALTVAADISQKKNDDAILLVMPADHIIENDDEFSRAVLTAARLAYQHRLVTFGVVPDKAETGYGYIRKGQLVNDEGMAFSIDAFVEKPDEQTAKNYLKSGDFLWNSGMFVVLSSLWLDFIQELSPAIAEAARSSVKNALPDLDFCRLDVEAFKSCPSDSIDYAVMEKISPAERGSKTAVVPLDAGWSDMGAWSAVYDVSEKDENGNRLFGDVMLHESENSLFRAEHRLIAGIGVENLLVVETCDAVLVAHRNHAQDVKKIVERLKRENRSEHLVHREVFRPWGSYEGVVAGDRFQVKRIIVKPGAQLSLQMHHHRAEHWIVVKGTAKVTCGDKEFLLSENESTYIPIGEKHRLENPGNLPLEIIEVQSGGYLGEDDIVRFEDRYGRET